MKYSVLLEYGPMVTLQIGFTMQQGAKIYNRMNVGAHLLSLEYSHMIQVLNILCVK